VWLVFVVGAVASHLGFLGSFVLVGDSMAQFRFQAVPLGGDFRPMVEHVADGVDRQGRAAACGRLSDRELFFHREQLDHPQAQQRPIQFAQGSLRSFAAQFAAAEGLFERAELQLSVPIIMPPKVTLVSGVFREQAVVGKEFTRFGVWG
jgi:hypothetical protein